MVKDLVQSKRLDPSILKIAPRMYTGMKLTEYTEDETKEAYGEQLKVWWRKIHLRSSLAGKCHGNR